MKTANQQMQKKSSSHFDVLVIGGGSGLEVSSAASSMDLKVAVVERGPLGGTCLNRGCIPSKALLHSADIMRVIQGSRKFGIHVDKVSVDFPSVMEWMRQVIRGDSDQIEQAIKRDDNSTLFKVEAKFIDSENLQAGNETISADKIIIAAGTRPHIPGIPGLKDAGYLTSTTLLDINEQPEHLVILGGGFIAAEYGYFFSLLGTKVSVIQRHANMLPKEDEEVSQFFTEQMRKYANLYTDAEMVDVKNRGKEKTVTVKQKNKKEFILQADAILVAAGRIPNTDILQLDKVNIKTDKKGFVITDQYLQTSRKNAWALGDIVGKYQLKHVANYESFVVTMNALKNQKIKADYSAIPHAVFAHPQIGSVGMTEQEAKDRKIKYKIAKYQYSQIGKAIVIGATEGFAKSVIDAKTNRILGVHIVGESAPELVHEAIVVMNSPDPTPSSILRSIHIHPTLSEIMPGAVANVLDDQ